MIDYNVISLLDAIIVFGLQTINDSFKFFTCSEEKDLEDFLINKAIDYENTGKGKTFLIIDTVEYRQNRRLIIVAYYKVKNVPLMRQFLTGYGDTIIINGI